jgi:precorrin-6B methylase 2
VPKLAGEILSWLKPEKDDKILDIGCGGEIREEISLVNLTRNLTINMMGGKTASWTSIWPNCSHMERARCTALTARHP